MRSYILLCLLASLMSAVSAPRMETVAGTGMAGLSGDNGDASDAQLNNPFGVVRGPDGSLYVCDTMNHMVRKISPDNRILAVAGTGTKGYTGDGDPASEALLNEPYEVRFDSGGHLYFVEMRNHLVRRVDAESGLISTVAGTGREGFSGDDGPATEATLKQPHSIQFDANDNLFICDIGNHRIRKVTRATGKISTFAGTGGRGPTPDGAPIAGTPLNGPRAIDFDRAGGLWLALREGNAVYRLDVSHGTLHHWAGTGRSGFSGHDGPALEATLSGPKGLSVGPDGNVYLADTESHSIRMIDVSTRRIHLIAGTGERGDGPDGDPLRCRMVRPHGIFVDRDGTVFVGDSETHRVRAIRMGVGQ